jgi:arsenite methyltransferase
MNTNAELKETVRAKYAEIALRSKTDNETSCCGATASCCGDDVSNIMSDDYSKLDGYNPDADLGLGCGIPTEFAKIKEGDTVGAAELAMMPLWRAGRLVGPGKSSESISQRK